MTSKTRKRIWPVSLAMSIGVVGVLAAFLVLAANPATTQAHDPGDGETHDQLCAAMTANEQMDHDAAAGAVEGAPICNEPDTNGDTNGGNGDGDNGNGDAPEHAGPPRDFELEVLDNGVRLHWKTVDSATVADGARFMHYQVHRDAYNVDQDNPINMYGDAYMNFRSVNDLPFRDLGLAYETTYTYKVRAVVHYAADDTMAYGDWSEARSITTADSGRTFGSVAGRADCRSKPDGRPRVRQSNRSPLGRAGICRYGPGDGRKRRVRWAGLHWWPPRRQGRSRRARNESPVTGSP